MKTLEKTIEQTLPIKKEKGKPSLTIFLVEDDKLFLHALGYQLHKREGYKVHCYSSGEECIKNLHLNPDFVVLDYYLNDNNPSNMDGLSVLRKIKRIKPSTVVIMLSAQKNLSIALKSLKEGAYTYLIKNNQTISQLYEIIDKVP